MTILKLQMAYEEFDFLPQTDWLDRKQVRFD